MKVGAVVLLMVVGSAAAIAGAPIPGLSHDPNADALMLYHWWTSPSEAAAVSALVDVFNKQYPEVAVKPTVANSHGGGSKMFVVISGAVATGRPPDAVQVAGAGHVGPHVTGGV